MSRSNEELELENETLRTLVAGVRIPCHYCGLDDMARCARGFPGCPLADDLILGQAGADARKAIRNQPRGSGQGGSRPEGTIWEGSEMADEKDGLIRLTLGEVANVTHISLSEIENMVTRDEEELKASGIFGDDTTENEFTLWAEAEGLTLRQLVARELAQALARHHA